MSSINYGKVAELKSAIYLRQNGYSILEHNYHSRFGEVDIIAENGEYLAFVEVKMRNSNAIFTPREAVDLAKQKKIIATSAAYIAQYKIDLQPRFDVIEVYMDNNQIKSIKHLENAFQLV